MTRLAHALPSVAALAVASVVTTAHAVPYALPSTAALPFSQIQPEGGGQTVCATWLDGGACDVPDGRYRLLTYDAGWTGEPARTVTIGGADEGAAEAAPANLRADVYSTRSLELFWDRPAPGVPTRYEVRRDGEVVGIKDGTSFYQTDLEPGRTYRYEVTRVPADGERSATARLDVAPTSNEPTPVITVDDTERLILVAFDEMLGEGHAEETLAFGDLPRELGLDVPDPGAADSFGPLMLVCDNGGTADYFFRRGSSSTYERYEFDGCQLDATALDGTLEKTASIRTGEHLEIGGDGLVIDRPDRTLEFDGSVLLSTVDGLGRPLQRFESRDVTRRYSRPDGTVEFGGEGSGGGDTMLVCGEQATQRNSATGVSAPAVSQRVSGTFVLKSPATSGETLNVRTPGEFARITSGGLTGGSETFLTGRLQIRAEDGGELSMDVDNGDPSTYTVDLTTRDGDETQFRLPIAPVMQRVSASFLERCAD